MDKDDDGKHKDDGGKRRLTIEFTSEDGKHVTVSIKELHINEEDDDASYTVPSIHYAILCVQDFLKDYDAMVTRTTQNNALMSGLSEAFSFAIRGGGDIPKSGEKN